MTDVLKDVKTKNTLSRHENTELKSAEVKNNGQPDMTRTNTPVLTQPTSARQESPIISESTPRLPDRRAARRKTLTLSGDNQVEYYDLAGTLLIGDSLLKGIQTRGLHDDVDILTLPGKKTHDVCTRLKYLDLSTCDKIVIHIGGNDIASGLSVSSMEKQLREMLEQIDNGTRKVYLCSICPRTDVDVRPVNSMLKALCNTSYAKLLEVNRQFVYEDGKTKSFLYYGDGIHLNARGSSTLVRAINSVVHITRNLTQSYRYGDKQQYSGHRMESRRQPWTKKRIQCDNCGMFNHLTADCRRNGHLHQRAHRRSLDLDVNNRYKQNHRQSYPTYRNDWRQQQGRNRRTVADLTREPDSYLRRSPSHGSQNDEYYMWGTTRRYD